MTGGYPKPVGFVRRYVSARQQEKSKASATSTVATKYADARRPHLAPEPETGPKFKPQCQFRSPETPVLQHRWHQGSPNPLLKGVLTALQFP